MIDYNHRMKYVMSLVESRAILDALPMYAYNALLEYIEENIEIPSWVLDMETQQIDHALCLIRIGLAADILKDFKGIILNPKDLNSFLEDGTRVWCEDDGETYTVAIQTSSDTVFMHEKPGEPFSRQSLTVVD